MQQQHETSGPFQTERDNWTAEALRVYGFVNHVHLMRRFGISDTTARRDIERILKINPLVKWDEQIRGVVQHVKH